MISASYGWTDEQILDLTMARIRQIRDVIVVRQQEDLKRDLTYKELEVQALIGAVHAAAGNKAGMRAASSFRFHAEKPAEVTEQKLGRMFPAGPEGLISDEELAAAIERQKAAQP